MGLMLINHSNPYIHSTTILSDKHVREHAHLFMSTFTSYAPGHIYIAEMRTKGVSKCTVTSERSVFS